MTLIAIGILVAIGAYLSARRISKGPAEYYGQTFVKKFCEDCGAPCEEKFNSGDPAWVCTMCRKIQDRGY
jgi:hypothetical protein